MKRNILVSSIAAGCFLAISLPVWANSQQSNSNENDSGDGMVPEALEFKCETKNNSLYTIAKVSEEKSYPVLNWHTKYFRDLALAETNCENLSKKLQGYYDNGQLKNNSSFAYTNKDSQSVTICLEPTKDKSCNDLALLTIKTKDKPNQVLCYLEPKSKEEYAKCSVRGSIRKPKFSVFSWLFSN